MTTGRSCRAAGSVRVLTLPPQTRGLCPVCPVQRAARRRWRGGTPGPSGPTPRGDSRELAHAGVSGKGPATAGAEPWPECRLLAGTWEEGGHLGSVQAPRPGSPHSRGRFASWIHRTAVLAEGQSAQEQQEPATVIPLLHRQVNKSSVLGSHREKPRGEGVQDKGTASARALRQEWTRLPAGVR